MRAAALHRHESGGRRGVAHASAELPGGHVLDRADVGAEDQVDVVNDAFADHGGRADDLFFSRLEKKLERAALDVADEPARCASSIAVWPSWPQA